MIKKYCYLILIIKSNINLINSSIWPIHGTLTGTTILRVDLGLVAMKKKLYISQSSKTGALPSDVLVSYPGHLCICVCGGSYSPLPAEMQLTYSTTPAKWVSLDFGSFLYIEVAKRTKHFFKILFLIKNYHFLVVWLINIIKKVALIHAFHLQIYKI